MHLPITAAIKERGKKGKGEKVKNILLLLCVVKLY